MLRGGNGGGLKKAELCFSNIACDNCLGWSNSRNQIINLSNNRADEGRHFTHFHAHHEYDGFHGGFSTSNASLYFGD